MSRRRLPWPSVPVLSSLLAAVSLVVSGGAWITAWQAQVEANEIAQRAYLSSLPQALGLEVISFDSFTEAGDGNTDVALTLRIRNAGTADSGLVQMRLVDLSPLKGYEVFFKDAVGPRNVVFVTSESAVLPLDTRIERTLSLALPMAVRIRAEVSTLEELRTWARDVDSFIALELEDVLGQNGRVVLWGCTGGKGGYFTKLPERCAGAAFESGG